MEVGKEIRQFMHDLFGSKVLDILQLELLHLRQDFELRIQEHKELIAELRMEKAQLNAVVSMYQININQRVGIDPTRVRSEKPSFANFKNPPVMTSWQKEQAEHNAQIEKELAEEAAAAGK